MRTCEEGHVRTYAKCMHACEDGHVRMDVVYKRPAHVPPMALLLTQRLVSNSEYQCPSPSHSHSSQSQSRALPGASIVLAIVPLQYVISHVDNIWRHKPSLNTSITDHTCRYFLLIGLILKPTFSIESKKSNTIL